MRRGFIFLLFLISMWSCKKRQGNPHVEIQTQYGSIEIELFEKQAPKTVKGFLQYVDSGFYNNSSFYRVLNDENQPSNATKTDLIQGGLWKTNQKKAAGLPGIPHETTQQTGIRHLDGTISLARLAPGTASTEFFICLGQQAGLDYGGENIPDKQGYAAFGRVVKGMDIVRKISRQNDDNQYFDPAIAIYNIVRL